MFIFFRLRQKAEKSSSKVHDFKLVTHNRSGSASLRPDLHDIRLLVMQDHFPECSAKIAPEYECLHKALKVAQCHYFVSN